MALTRGQKGLIPWAEAGLKLSLLLGKQGEGVRALGTTLLVQEGIEAHSKRRSPPPPTPERRSARTVC